MELSEFDYDLPPDRIATEPARPRDSARLLVVGGRLEDRVVGELPALLRPGDLLVANDTRVVPARIFGRRGTGGRVEVLLLRREPGGVHRALVKAHRRLRPGETIALDGGLRAALLERPDGDAVWRIDVAVPAGETLLGVLERVGHVPLPPYLKRPDRPEDRTHYQTVFADRAGSAAAPTAGLHFTARLLDALADRGIGLARVTLHVGYGTFQPIEAERVEEHRMHAEEYEVPEETARAIRDRPGRLVAVGTTTTRVLETLAASGGIRAARGTTDLFLHPGNPPRAIDGLLTNFHLPASSLLLLACGFGGTPRVLDAYRHAVRSGYRFFSYGDAMLLWPR